MLFETFNLPKNRKYLIMEFKKSKKLIKKIVTQMETFESLGDELSSFEVQLLHGYIDALKASIPMPESSDVVESAPIKPVNTKQVVSNDQTQLEETKHEQEVTETSPSDNEELEPENPTKQVSTSTLPEQQSSESSEDKKETQKEETEKSSKINIKPVGTGSKNDLDTLFEKIEITDLSQKLGVRSVKNIRDSLSINERILTQNELFDKDQSLMNETINTLDMLQSYEEAVAFLKGGVAKTLEWGSEEKRNKAAQFMKLVQRRFM